MRDFHVWVDGKHSGTYRMTITKQDDGSLAMSSQAEIKVKKAFITVYRYSYTGVEVWKDGRLQSLKSSCNDDGKESTVHATFDGKQVHVQANGQETNLRPDIWLTPFWSLPDPKQRQGAVPILDADTGKELAGRIQHMGTATVNAAGQAIACSHYRVTTGAHDVWYDSSERMVRQEWVEDGHRTILILARVQR